MFNYFNARLSIAARLWLMALVSMVPDVLLTGFFVQQSYLDISFAQKEDAGTHYLADLWPIFMQTAQGTPAKRREGASAYDARFSTSAAARAFDEATSRRDKLGAGQALIGAVADGSNLTLDPDLDSFYAMDAVTVRLPGMVAAATALQDAADEPTGQRSRLVDIAAATVRLQISSDDADASLKSAMRNNAAGLTARTLSGAEADLRAATTLVAARSRTLLDGGAAPDLASRKADLLRAIDATWLATNGELTRLLRARLDGFFSKLTVSLVIAGAGVLLSALIAQAVSVGLSRRILRLVGVMDRLIVNDMTHAVPYLDDRNETGRIAHTLVAFKDNLIEAERLRSEKRLVEERAEALTAERDATAAHDLRQAGIAVVELGRALDKLSQGDLLHSVSTPLYAAADKLRVDLNQATTKLRNVMIDVADRARTIGTGSVEITAVTDELSDRTQQQVTGLRQAAVSLDQITARIKSTADQAAEARVVVSETRTRTEGGGGIVKQAIDAMTKIERSSGQVGQIIGVIDEIAFQTNLLALNAGVEAARAGDAGRGFAVVAAEVGILARRSAEAAKQIAALIAEASTEVGLGVDLVARTGRSLTEISVKVTDLERIVNAIASSAADQSSGLREVNEVVGSMDGITQRNAIMVQQSNAASHALREEADALSVLIGTFKIGAGQGAGRSSRGPARRADAAPSRSAA